MPDAKRIANGRKGGKTRAKNLTKAQLSKIGQQGGKALWAKIRAGELRSEEKI